MTGLGLLNYIDDPDECEKMGRKRAVNRVLERKRAQQKEAAAVQAAEMRGELFEGVVQIIGDTLRREAESDCYAATTRGQYAAALKRFNRYRVEVGLSGEELTPEIISAYLLEIAGGVGVGGNYFRSAILARTAISEAWQAGRESNPAEDVLVRATIRWLKLKQAEEQQISMVPPDINDDPATPAEH